MEKNFGRTFNPWFSMWMKPRATIRQIVDRDPEHMVLLLAAIYGISKVLDRAVAKNLGDKISWPFIFIIAIIAGPFSGVISLYLGGLLIRWTGSWIGGEGTAENIRAAIAWAYVPIIWTLVLWIPQLLLFGQELFTEETPIMDESLILTGIFWGISLIELIVAIWTIVIFLKCIGEVQGFSAWKALGNVCLAGLVIIVPIFIIALIV
jgi:hypothetical protein